MMRPPERNFDDQTRINRKIWHTMKDHPSVYEEGTNAHFLLEKHAPYIMNLTYEDLQYYAEEDDLNIE